MLPSLVMVSFVYVLPLFDIVDSIIRYHNGVNYNGRITGIRISAASVKKGDFRSITSWGRVRVTAVSC